MTDTDGTDSNSESVKSEDSQGKTKTGKPRKRSEELSRKVVEAKMARKATREKTFDKSKGVEMPRLEGQSPRGLPLMFQEEIADIILDRLAGGESLRSICRDPAMPDGSTVRKWIARNPDFSRQYAIAREEQADSIFDETLDIADSIPAEAPNEEIQRARLRIDTRKWVAGKIRPKKYGDLLKHEVTGADGGAIAMQAVNVGQLDYDQREALAGMLEQLAVTSTNEADDL